VVILAGTRHLESRVVRMEDRLLERLTVWGTSLDGTPGNVPTRYACEIVLPEHPDTADLRVAIHKAFRDGMAFANSLADEARRITALQMSAGPGPGPETRRRHRGR
jgi:hypothetical protein